MQQPQRQKLSPPQYAKRLGVSSDKILIWIRSGELRAIDVSNGNERPRYLIDLADIVAFEQRRCFDATSQTEKASITTPAATT